MLCALLFIVVATWNPSTQPQTVLIRVTDDAGALVANAEVLNRSTGERRLTNERGETRLQWPSDGNLRVRIRQIGFAFADRALNRSTDGDEAVFRLRRVVYQLPTVFASSDACDAHDDSAAGLAAGVLEQLRLSAEQYESFRRDYPFRAEIGRRTARVRYGRSPSRVAESTGTVDSDDWHEPYRPGEVIDRRGLGFSVPILFLSTLADSVFWAHHCFGIMGSEQVGSERWLRLEFSPTRVVRSPDWAGVAFIDSATSALRRLEFRLVNLRRDYTPQRFEGYTTFLSPSPYMVVPDTTLAIWWRRAPTGDDWGDPDVGQMLYIRRITWRRTTPPGVSSRSLTP